MSVNRIAAVILLSFLAGTPVCYSQNSGPIEEMVRNSDWKKRDQPEYAVIDAALSQRLDAVNALIDKQEFEAALEELDNLLRRRSNEYAEAVILQTAGYVHARLENTDQSISFWEQALSSRALTQGQHQGVLFSLAHQYAAQLDFEKAIELMSEWFQYEENPFADAFMFTGSCFSALERYADALPFIERAIDVSDRPIESWYRMAVSLQIELAQYEATVPYLKKMLEHWTQNQDYWDQLAGIYLELGDDRAALDTTMIAYHNGMVTTPERILGLVELNLVHGIPRTAAEILDNEMRAGAVPESPENLEILVQAWIAAREHARAIPVIDRITALTGDGDQHLRAAQLYVQGDDWEGAVSSASQALDAGGHDKVKALLMLGTGYSELGQFSESLAAFRTVLDIGTDEETENAAQWIEFVLEAQKYRQQASTSQSFD